MSAIHAWTFSSAKAALSAVMDEVVHEQRPQLINRHGDRQAMLLVRPEDARRWLETFRFSLHVTLDDGEVAVVADPVGVVGIGDSFDSALDDLSGELQNYAQRFFERPSFYKQTPAAQHEPWLLRFALTHPDEHRALLDADIEASMTNGVTQ